jgi:dihydroflavonol-4-reductase
VNILVTGGTGFLGSHLCQRLAGDGHTVTVFRRSSSDITPLAILELNYRIGDVTDQRSVDAAVDGHDVVIHAAASTAYFGVSGETQHRINFEGTHNVALACCKTGARLVHVSSVAAVGITSEPSQPADESFVFNLDGSGLIYHITKRRAEEAVLRMVEQGLDAVVVNPALIFGPKGAGYQGAQAIGETLCRRVITHAPGGRCVVHVLDVADGIVRALEQGRRGQRYILGGENITFRAMGRTVCRQLGLKRMHISIPSNVAEQGNRARNLTRRVMRRDPLPRYDGRFCFQFYDSTKAEKELGYTRRSFASIVEECAESLGWSNRRGRPAAARFLKRAER